MHAVQNTGRNVDLTCGGQKSLFEGSDLAQESPPTIRVELGEDVVEEQDRCFAASFCEHAVLGDFERKDRRTLLSLGTVGRQETAAEAEDDIVSVRADQPNLARGLERTLLRQPRAKGRPHGFPRRDLEPDV